MSLQVEVNIVYFPEYHPSPREGEPSIPWTNELKQKLFHQQAEVHMINIGPVTQEILDSKLFDADLGGVSFTWNKETSEYTWISGAGEAAGNNGKPLPLKYILHLLAVLRKVGYQTQNNWYRPDRESPSDAFHGLIRKEIWYLEKKF